MKLKFYLIFPMLAAISIAASACPHSPSQKAAFRKTHPCPATGKTYGACKGYIVDHIKPLCKGGADRPFNMQWQTVAAAKAKDKVECKK